jgi:cytoplasmic iron level regulating protein YaaA (DUF328/UPF0246 family)
MFRKDVGWTVMKIILSPAKKMNEDTDSFEVTGLPAFIGKTEEILIWLKSKTYEELKDLWKCNDKIARQNFNRLKSMQLDTNLTPAIISYEGIAYQYMAPAVFENAQLAYIEEHLRILSAFYGVLRPLDGVAPYRLEMQAKAGILGCKDLYEFWGDRLYGEVHDESGIIINLASKEYSKCIEKYLAPDDTYITCVFGETVRGKFITKGTYAKMARGEMVRYMAENEVGCPEGLKSFDRLNYKYRKELSSEDKYVFERAAN